MVACWRRVGATQFSLYMAIANMGLSTGSMLLGPLDRWFGYSGLLLVVLAWMMTVSVLLLFLDVERHRTRVERLDAATDSEELLPVLAL